MESNGRITRIGIIGGIQNNCVDDIAFLHFLLHEDDFEHDVIKTVDADAFEQFYDPKQDNSRVMAGGLLSQLDTLATKYDVLIWISFEKNVTRHIEYIQSVNDLYTYYHVENHPHAEYETIDMPFKVMPQPAAGSVCRRIIDKGIDVVKIILPVSDTYGESNHSYCEKCDNIAFINNVVGKIGYALDKTPPAALNFEYNGFPNRQHPMLSETIVPVENGLFGPNVSMGDIIKTGDVLGTVYSTIDGSVIEAVVYDKPYNSVIVKAYPNKYVFAGKPIYEVQPIHVLRNNLQPKLKNKRYYGNQHP